MITKDTLINVKLKNLAQYEGYNITAEILDFNINLIGSRPERSFILAYSKGKSFNSADRNASRYARTTLLPELKRTASELPYAEILNLYIDKANSADITPPDDLVITYKLLHHEAEGFTTHVRISPTGIIFDILKPMTDESVELNYYPKDGFHHAYALLNNGELDFRFSNAFTIEEKDRLVSFYEDTRVELLHSLRDYFTEYDYETYLNNHFREIVGDL